MIIAPSEEVDAVLKLLDESEPQGLLLKVMQSLLDTDYPNLGDVGFEVEVDLTIQEVVTLFEFLERYTNFRWRNPIEAFIGRLHMKMYEWALEPKWVRVRDTKLTRNVIRQYVPDVLAANEFMRIAVSGTFMMRDLAEDLRAADPSACDDVNPVSHEDLLQSLNDFGKDQWDLIDQSKILFIGGICRACLSKANVADFGLFWLCPCGAINHLNKHMELFEDPHWGPSRYRLQRSMRYDDASDYHLTP